MPGTTLEIGERSFEIAPFKLGELRKVAPFIDAMNKQMKTVGEYEKRNKDLPKEEKEHPPLEVMVELAHSLCQIIAIGLVKVDATCDVDWLEGQIDLTEVQPLTIAVLTLLQASGLENKGEAPAPSPPPQVEGAGASETSSAE